MATFNIKRGDSMPPLIVSMRVAGSDPETYYNYDNDDVGGILENNTSSLGNPTVKFIMTNLETGNIVGIPANVSQRFTGYGELYHSNTDPTKTLLRYNWQQPSLNYNPANPGVNDYAGDTGISGVYKGEFEVIYATTDTGYQSRKRSFPATPGDTLIINVLPDSNDKQPSESI